LLAKETRFTNRKFFFPDSTRSIPS